MLRCFPGEKPLADHRLELLSLHLVGLLFQAPKSRAEGLFDFGSRDRLAADLRQRLARGGSAGRIGQAEIDHEPESAEKRGGAQATHKPLTCRGVKPMQSHLILTWLIAPARSVLEIGAIVNLLNPGLKLPPRLSQLLYPPCSPLDLSFRRVQNVAHRRHGAR